MPLKPEDVEIIKRIEFFLGKHPDSYFDHSGGMVTLGQARDCWETAQRLIKLIKNANPEDFPKS